jgi:hypothetical protein
MASTNTKGVVMTAKEKKAQEEFERQQKIIAEKKAAMGLGERGEAG